MESRGFNLFEGIQLADIGETVSNYTCVGSELQASLSAEFIAEFFDKATEVLKAPVFFFIEIPCTDDEEKTLRKSSADGFHYRLYYLDGCTTEVAKAILDRFGGILFADGIVRFGFGSHETGDELYLMKYQVIRVFSENVKPYAEILDYIGVEKRTELSSLWDKLSPENTGECCVVECEGETIYDIPDILKDAGMYFSEIVDE